MQLKLQKIWTCRPLLSDHVSLITRDHLNKERIYVRKVLNINMHSVLKNNVINLPETQNTVNDPSSRFSLLSNVLVALQTLLPHYVRFP